MSKSIIGSICDKLNTYEYIVIENSSEAGELVFSSLARDSDYGGGVQARVGKSTMKRLAAIATQKDSTIRRTLVLHPGCGPVYCYHHIDNKDVINFAVKIKYVNRPKDSLEL